MCNLFEGDLLTDIMSDVHARDAHKDEVAELGNDIMVKLALGVWYQGLPVISLVGLGHMICRASWSWR